MRMLEHFQGYLGVLVVALKLNRRLRPAALAELARAAASVTLPELLSLGGSWNQGCKVKRGLTNQTQRGEHSSLLRKASMSMFAAEMPLRDSSGTELLNTITTVSGEFLLHRYCAYNYEDLRHTMHLPPSELRA